MSIKRCVHTISINAPMLHKILELPQGTRITATDAKYIIAFQNDMSPEDKKSLANWLITSSVKTNKIA